MHSNKCFRSDGDWFCAGDCRNDEHEELARLKAQVAMYKEAHPYDSPFRPRRFKSMLFMGNGDHSMAKCYELVNELQDALTLLSGLQQGPTTEDDWEGVRNIAKDLFTALTGQEVVETKKAKYP